MAAESRRLESLDALRTAAVCLVIFDHWGLAYPDDAVARRAATAGWVGVDLFFVLSGFLVSGLIFREHQQYGVVDARRFLIRRGLKIYPAFYVFVVVSVVFADELLFADSSLNALGGGDSLGPRVLAETLFVQNYVDGLWTHTWTLAVEEHFYLLLALGAAVASRRGWMPRSGVAAAALAGVVMTACFSFRAVTALVVDFQWKRWYAPTHVRIDTLLVGVFLSFLYHHERAAVERLVRRHRAVLVVTMACALSPVIFVERSRKLMYTAGLTSIAIGFGLLVVLMVTSTRVTSVLRRRPWNAVCAAGRHSYSVYLWHVAVIITIDRIAPDLSKWTRLPLAIAASFAFGVVVAKLVEIPALRLRDRMFPSRSGTLTTLAASEEAMTHDRQIPDRRSRPSARPVGAYDPPLGRDGGG